MKEREYLYMRKTDDGQTYCIMYNLGKYLVARMLRSETGTLCYTIRQYKTISGAERFLREHFNGSCFVYGTLEAIQKGEYWRS